MGVWIHVLLTLTLQASGQLNVWASLPLVQGP
jgi:hypothetical protein